MHLLPIVQSTRMKSQAKAILTQYGGIVYYNYTCYAIKKQLYRIEQKIKTQKRTRIMV